MVFLVTNTCFSGETPAITYAFAFSNRRFRLSPSLSQQIKSNQNNPAAPSPCILDNLYKTPHRGSEGVYFIIQWSFLPPYSLPPITWRASEMTASTKPSPTSELPGCLRNP
jgi:hypothetical protein